MDYTAEFYQFLDKLEAETNNSTLIEAVRDGFMITHKQGILNESIGSWVKNTLAKKLLPLTAGVMMTGCALGGNTGMKPYEEKLDSKPGVTREEKILALKDEIEHTFDVKKCSIVPKGITCTKPQKGRFVFFPTSDVSQLNSGTLMTEFGFGQSVGDGTSFNAMRTYFADGTSNLYMVRYNSHGDVISADKTILDEYNNTISVAPISNSHYIGRNEPSAAEQTNIRIIEIYNDATDHSLDIPSYQHLKTACDGHYLQTGDPSCYSYMK